MTLSVRLGALGEYLRGSLWFLPGVSVLAALLLAIALTRVTVEDSFPLAALLLGVGADGARGMLQVVAGAVITVTGLVFSLTVVALQLASSQFSPRLLRTFLRNLGNQVVLAIFLATFVYALTVLSTIRGAEDGRPAFVPQVAVLVAFAFVLASVAALVYFIHHIAQQIRVDVMMREVHADTLEAVDRTHPDPLGNGEDGWLPDPPARAAVLAARRSGFVQAVSVAPITSCAEQGDLVVRFVPAVGDHVLAGGPLAWCWAREPGQPRLDVDALTGEANAAVQVGFERTLRYDVRFGIRQLVDIAAKALSPGVNDPTTAVDALGHLAALLTVLARRRIVPQVGLDGEGTPRVAVPSPDFADYLDLACGQIRRYGSREPAVMAKLLWLLGEVGYAAPEAGRGRLAAAQADLVVSAAERDIDESHDLSWVKAARVQVDRALR